LVAAESNFEIPDQDEVFLVNQRKYNLDPCRPWWERLFFRCAFLPFVRFAFRRMHIGAPAGMDADGNIFLLEEVGIYWDKQVAKENCKGEFWQVKPLLLNVAFPGETVQYKGHEYPRSTKPYRHRRRTLKTAPAQVQDLAKIKQSFEHISKIAGT
jgi:hypothetical protein